MTYYFIQHNDNIDKYPENGIRVIRHGRKFEGVVQSLVFTDKFMQALFANHDYGYLYNSLNETNITVYILQGYRLRKIDPEYVNELLFHTTL